VSKPPIKAKILKLRRGREVFNTTFMKTGLLHSIQQLNSRPEDLKTHW